MEEFIYILGLILALLIVLIVWLFILYGLGYIFTFIIYNFIKLNQKFTRKLMEGKK